MKNFVFCLQQSVILLIKFFQQKLSVPLPKCFSLYSPKVQLPLFTEKFFSDCSKRKYRGNGLVVYIHFAYMAARKIIGLKDSSISLASLFFSIAIPPS